MSKSWMVRAGRNALFDAFKEKLVVAIGWPALGDLLHAKTRKVITDALAQVYPGGNPQNHERAAGAAYARSSL